MTRPEILDVAPESDRDGELQVRRRNFPPVDDPRKPVLVGTSRISDRTLGTARGDDRELEGSHGASHGQDLRAYRKNLQQELANETKIGNLGYVNPPDAAEVARRVRAARAYSKLSREALAKAIDYHPSTLDEIEGKRSKLRGATWEELWTIADACDVPREWFSADLGRLYQIVPDDMPRFAEVSPSLADARERLRRAQAEEARRIRERHSKPDGETGSEDARESQP